MYAGGLTTPFEVVDVPGGVLLRFLKTGAGYDADRERPESADDKWARAQAAGQTPCMHTHVHPHVYGMGMACTGGPGPRRPARPPRRATAASCSWRSRRHVYGMLEPAPPCMYTHVHPADPCDGGLLLLAEPQAKSAERARVRVRRAEMGGGAVPKDMSEAAVRARRGLEHAHPMHAHTGASS